MSSKRRGAGYRPFRVLQELVGQGKLELQPPTDKRLAPPRQVDASLSDEEAFLSAMEEVTPLGWSDTPLQLPGPIEVSGKADDESEALAKLRALVGNRGELDPFVTGEGVAGAATRRGSAHLARLKNGHYSVQAHLDLHGSVLPEAREKLYEFIHQSVRQGHCCVRIVHGRGTHSPAEPGVLKTHITRWLSSRKMSRFVVAFASARWTDGGAGAIYVLLYRKHRPPSP